MTWVKNNAKALLFLILGIVFIFVGVHLGEVQLVFQNAVRICLECVGIG